MGKLFLVIIFRGSDILLTRVILRLQRLRGKIPSVSSVGIKKFHTSHGHVHKKLLRSTAKHLGVVLEGSLRECEGCSVAKDLGKPIGRTTSTSAEKVFGCFLEENDTCC